MNINLLREVCEIAGAPGFENPIRELIEKEVTPLVDEVQIDNMGNLIAIKRGKSDAKIMVAAHMDEIGFMVTHIDEDGFIRFHTLGGFDPKTLTAQRVIIHGEKDVIGVMGSKPIHLMTPEDRNKPLRTQDFFIDTGMPPEEVSKLISIGNPITRERKLIEMGNCVNCKSIDNRVSVFVLLETLRNLKDKDIDCDLYGVFSVQEEIGIRGASVAAQSINPDFGLGLDTTIAFDVPGAKPHEMVTALGAGTAIKIMDSSVVSDYRMVKFLKTTADKHHIKWQPEVLTGGGTDTAAVQRRGKNGSIAGAISIPTRHIHQVIEMAHKEDIMNSIALLEHAIVEMTSYDWSFKAK